MEASKEARRDPGDGAEGRNSTGSTGEGRPAVPPGRRDGVAELFAQVDLRWRNASVVSAEDGAEVPKERPLICITCGLEGHPCCGMRYWTALRAAWLRVAEEEVARVPSSFEDAGPLQLSRAASTGPIRELSEGELEDLEDCLDAVQRPFPRLSRSVPLMQAVQCAEALWDTDD
mmetsp:Transcript_87999/g.152459  ORF Transcript_87999/g.152459 Transcript_87999/m.152459 type:complete len:174 (+) Transcript_87999:229-750(+)